MSCLNIVKPGAGTRYSRFAAQRSALACALAAMTIFAAPAGCLKLEPTLTLNADGSGLLHLRYEMSATAVRQLNLAGGIVRRLDIASGRTEPAAAVTTFLPLDERQIGDMFAPFEERGVRLINLHVEKRREWHVVALEVRFANLADLMQLPIFSSCGRSLTRTRAGSYQLAFKAPATTPGVTPPDLGDKAGLQQLQPLLGGLKVAVTINVPADILETDAPRKTRRMAAWEFDFDRNPAALDALNRKTFNVVFTSAGAALPEFSFPAK